MKEIYVEPELTVITFAACDVITTSNVETTSEWEIRENEGAPSGVAAWG